MASRKTQYVIHFTVDTQAVRDAVTDWLNKNGFQYAEKGGCQYYYSGNGVFGVCRCFEYDIQGRRLLVSLYLNGPENPCPLGDSGAGRGATSSYTELLQELVSAIGSDHVQTYDEEGNLRNVSLAVQNNTSNSECATWAFGMSIVALILGITGRVYGIVPMILAYSFGFAGLKSTKKNLATAAIILTSIGILLALCIGTVTI